MKPAARVHFGSGAPRLPDEGGRLPLALVFPDATGAALSALGWQAVYRVAWPSPWLRVERFFLTPGKNPAKSQDSGKRLRDFPVAAFSLGFELDGLALVQTLEAEDIPLLASQRPDYPLLLGGGPLAFLNPAPLSPVLDAWFVGEAEAGLTEILEGLAEKILAGTAKIKVLESLAQIPGMYVPGLSPLPVVRVRAPGGRTLFDPACSAFVSHESQFKDTMLLEVNRGCPYGCRFCAAGYVYRPPRQARIEDLEDLVDQAKPGKVGLVGTALTDWPDLPNFLHWLAERKVKFALSSVRADGVNEQLLSVMRASGIRTLTLALEGPSARLRRMANKKLKVEEFLGAVTLAGAHGINHLKVYVIVGWPGEQEDDYRELADFLAQVHAAGKVGQAKGIGHLTLGVNPLVPKPWTPLQWAPMASEVGLGAALDRVKSLAKPLRAVRVDGLKAQAARIQGLLARGDERVFEVYTLAAALGWKKALAAWSGDQAWYLDRERGQGEAFPWECLDIGVSRASLWREWQRYLEGRETPKCPATGCAACGACPGQDTVTPL